MFSIRRIVRQVLACAAGLLVTLSAGAGTPAVGPVTAQPPYLKGLASEVEFTAILSAGDAVKTKNKGKLDYVMVGLPDGLGAYDNGDGTFTLLMNHELRPDRGVARAHGFAGAFVSRWQIRKTDLRVLAGSDQIEVLKVWDPATQAFVPADATTGALNRLCSADLAAPSAFFNSQTGLGFSDGRIFLDGEESGSQGRGFAHLAGGRYQGTSFELPYLGRFSWENSVASSFEQDQTIVIGLDDSGGGNVYVYLGTKRDTGSPIEMAGLHDAGGLHAITFGTEVEGEFVAIAQESELTIPIQDDTAGVPAFSGLFRLDPVEDPRNATLDPDGTGLQRPEDGAWDASNPNVFYFVTTASFRGATPNFGTNTRLWRLTFADIGQPELGGTVEVLVEGNLDGPQMIDNIATDDEGNVYLQEDPGNQTYVARIWRYEPATDTLTVLGEHANANFPVATNDEESSGIIDATGLFNGVEGYDTAANRYFLVDVQAHYAIPGELVEGGQLLLMTVPR
jgi:hypothetical protein